MHVILEINHTPTGQVQGHLHRDDPTTPPQHYSGWLELIALLETPTPAEPSNHRGTGITGAPPAPLP